MHSENGCDARARAAWWGALGLALLAPACGRFGYDAIDDAGGPPDGAPPPPDYCLELPLLPAPPVVDGQLDPGLSLRPLVPVSWSGAGPDVPAGQGASYAAAWRPDGLYLFVQVVDPTRVPAAAGDVAWCGDGVEVYADSDGAYPNAPDYDDPGARQFTLGAPDTAADPVKRGDGYCIGCGGGPQPIDQATFLAVPTTDGYTLEMLVVAADLGLASWALAAGGAVGFDLAVNVSEPTAGAAVCLNGVDDGNRLGQYFLRVEAAPPVYPFANAAAFCTATLLP